ncbi:MAG: rhomboid family intramembrane serine protease [Pirellulales bacterium]|nr:rhomboid family intramembrane serine protease [Pirellulales bacterium]
MFIPLHDDNPTIRTPVVVYAVVAINVLAFLMTLGLSPIDQQLLVYRRGFVPARIGQLVERRPIPVTIQRLALNQFGQVVPFEEPYQLPPEPRQVFLSMLTCMFLHGGWLHLIGNMWFFWIFGNNVEDRLGHVAFLLFYLAGGLIATVSHWFVDPSSTIPVIGASGAVAAILGAYAITWPWARVHTLVFLFIFITMIDVPALLVLGFWFVGQLWSSLQGNEAGVAWWAHIGGFVAGAATMPLVGSLVGPEVRPRRPPPLDYDPEL